MNVSHGPCLTVSHCSADSVSKPGFRTKLVGTEHAVEDIVLLEEDTLEEEAVVDKLEEDAVVEDTLAKDELEETAVVPARLPVEDVEGDALVGNSVTLEGDGHTGARAGKMEISSRLKLTLASALNCEVTTIFISCDVPETVRGFPLLTCVHAPVLPTINEAQRTPST